MPVAMPFGQFVPRDTAVHRMDARAKIGLTAMYAIVLFAIDSWTGLAVGLAVVVTVIAISRVPWRLAVRGLKPIMWLVAFTMLANAVRLEPSGALFSVGPVSIEAEGLRRGAFFAVRILLLVVGSSVVTLTTSPVALTDALALLMRPLRAVRVPVDDFAMMLSIALRFMPTTAEEAERIVVAQTARGARFDEGGLLKRARAWIPVLVPLFVNLFRRADTLALAMEARCYRGEGRTRLREPKMRATDWVSLTVGVVAGVVVGILL